jgi:hypothetical protein
MVAESSAVGVYRSLDAGEDAVRKRGEGGFPIQHVPIIASGRPPSPPNWMFAARPRREPVSGEARGG